MNEVEKLRGLLTRCDEYLAAKGVIYDAKLRREIRAALSQQVELAPAQDEREATLEELVTLIEGAHANDKTFAEAIFDAGFRRPACTKKPAPAQAEGVGVVAFIKRKDGRRWRLYWEDEFLPGDEIEKLMTVAQHERIVAAITRPAQTEQQPVAWVSSGPDGVEADWYPGKGLDTLPIGAKLYAAPIAQTEQQPVGYQFQDREGVWKQFMNQRHYEDTLADGTWPIRAIYAAPQPEQSGRESVEAFVVGFQPGMSKVTLKIEAGRLPSWMDMGFPVTVLSAQGESHE